ncbi:Glycosyltransferase involved in cell wall bisynthesis [Loktanella atrilutea]|uniref:Glycosyltransferase involved in cell wall bisynthesis n=1 Tax=Loktanella atrilutea TaxID=366533 RepID=A0A1M4UQB4_LOKAT|nr:glycosyltransferase [Loktanella atrilutea]SHE58837.1 Glycosyltransferase involved in cell wall bisynthesis [Loktanella atrilutea]
MRVLLIGGEPFDYTIAFANAVASRMPVTLIVPRDRFAAALPFFDPQVTVRLIDWPRHRSLANLAFLWQLTRLIRAEAPDLIHVLSNTHLWLNLAVPLWRPVPVITTVHDVSLHPGDRDTAVLPGWAPRLMARLSRHVVVHGPTLARAAQRVFDIPGDRIHILPHPAIRRYADLAVATQPDQTDRSDAFDVLLFGRIFAYKGLDQLIRAEHLLGDRIPGLRITIAGRGDDPHALRALMGDPGRYVIHNRFIPDAEVAALFRATDLVVLPYTEASQSGVLPVAATFGVPAVVTDVGELRATVLPHHLGLVVPPNDPAALAEAIARLAQDPALRGRHGDAARAWAAGAIGADRVGTLAENLYADVHQKAKRAGSKGWA